MGEQLRRLKVQISQPLTWRSSGSPRPGIFGDGSMGGWSGADNSAGGGDGPMGDGSMGDGPMGDGPMGTSQSLRVGLGYHSDTPDDRDNGRDAAHACLARTHMRAIKDSHFFSKRKPPFSADVRKKVHWPVENQGPLHACTSHAIIGLIEFLIRRRHQRFEDFSRLFLYKTTRRILRWSGDSGATLRATLKAAARFGMPPEQYWPYNLRMFDVNPDSFLYSYCDTYQNMTYTRLDENGLGGEEVLVRVKQVLSDGVPVAFGFPVYSSLATDSPNIPLPADGDIMQGGHAVLAVGYDDKHNVEQKGQLGALILRNSWGPLWGNDGYGYLPYEYVLRQLAVDFWTVFNPDWLNPDGFGLGK